MVNEKSFICIQAFMVNELNLKGTELIAFAIIYGFSQDGESWFSGSRRYIADWCGCSLGTVSNNIQKLKDAGLIEKRVKFVNGMTMNDYRVCQKIIGRYQNLIDPLSEIDRPPLSKSDTHNIDIDNIDEKINIKRHKYGEYENVLLTDSQLSTLKDEFSDWEMRIDNLSSYMESTGKRYKNHYATIKNWAKKDEIKKPKAIYAGEF